MNTINKVLSPILLGLLAIGMLLTPTVSHAAGTLSTDAASRFSTVPHNAAIQDALREHNADMIVVMTDGIPETLLGAARIKLDEVTGRTSIHGQDPIYSFLSMVYQPELWWTARVLPVEHPRVAEILGATDKWISAEFVAKNPGRTKLQTEAADSFRLRDELKAVTDRLNAAEQVSRLKNRDLALSNLATPMLSEESILELVENPAAKAEAIAKRAELLKRYEGEKPFGEAVAKLFDRVNRIGHLHEELLLVPNTEDIRGDWVAPGATLIRATRLSTAGGVLDKTLAASFATGSAEMIGRAIGEFLDAARETGAYPSETRRHVKNLYLRISPFRSAAWVYLVCAILYGFYFFWNTPWMRKTATALFLGGFMFHTMAVGTRLYLTGHMPVSNMYESITFVSWAAMLMAGFGELVSKRGALGLGATILGFLLLTGSSFMPLHDTRLHPLRAVLNSYWLNIHVTMMLVSYAAFGLAAMFAGAYLIKALLKRESLFGDTPVMTMQQTEEFAYRLVQVGWPILTLGITLGAVWADTAWGRYWGWDPKETWAFITWIVYTIYLHTRIVMGWRGRLSATCCVLGFACVMITWLGVSYHPWFAGGLHTYASPT